MKDQRNTFEDLWLTRLKRVLTKGVAVTNPGRQRLRLRQAARLQALIQGSELLTFVRLPDAA
jgi:hypothetical protein